MVFAECVLTYIDAEKIDAMLEFFSDKFINLTFVSYEMFKPNDSFGKMMVRNFQVRLIFPAFAKFKDEGMSFAGNPEVSTGARSGRKVFATRLQPGGFLRHAQDVQLAHG